VLTERELDIMAILWERGSATSSEVRDALADPLAYNTVLTMLRILEEKGHARHEEDGRAFRYYPTTARKAVSRFTLSRVVDKLFRGSPRLLITELVRERSMDADDLRALRALLDEQIRKEGREP
jgi:BlaI family transcriptional regulator, penicillinase repressor